MVRVYTLVLYVLVTIITLQSTLVAAQLCPANENSTINSQLSFTINSALNEEATAQVQPIDIEQCIDCGCKCCPCCSNSLFTLLASSPSTAKQQSTKFSVEQALSPTPYYSLLRPPKI